ncbi:MAG TPA: SpoIIE family protein phosphatase [Cyclobacteriaceae bacterium]|nr:SpoIIE family protein phosphatase [Cyclobacteriaceae bacterium]HMV89347.1 SpoIIE family protein phosphatase [Cyclobacteriaceae bacterium]HMW98753.1 SpoIIE family protein phosphatase [Cyclobacteriaceae bacterium]HMX48614.1 SpoIIE family protein phosphatase [Cyclobacteriaceae bacterium]HMY95419.1 SpoIIE family protein phosphatase [Cyclobacteriaceae bacterium]
MRAKALSRMLFVIGVITWIALLFTDLSVVFSAKNNLPQEVPTWLPGIILNLYLITLYYYYKFKIDRDEQLNFVDLLWRVFATGLIATVLSLLLRLVEGLLKSTALTNNVVYVEVIYLINLGLMAAFLLASFAAWKRLILYQKSKWLLRGWSVFEYALLIGLLYTCFDRTPNETLYMVLLGIFVVMGLVLSANMKWVAFLNFRQKWTCLLLLLLTIFYFGYLSFTSSSLAETVKLGFTDHRAHLFIQSVMIFVIVYSVFSFLVILFNLPTTSVFEQKLEEVVNFQRISQSIQTEQSEESVYNILLETSVSSVFADAAWLETKDNSTHRVFTYRITEKEAYDIINHLKTQNVTGILDQGQDKTKNLSKHLGALKGSRFRSILAFPIYVKGENIGTLALLKELPDGFNKEMTKIVSTFANQAGISIENFRLLEEALQGERYKEELKIAKTVQKSLLPQVLEQDAQFEIAAFSESADEVGGDYYDTLRINQHETSLIIADVSGKGTTAAFHMSQMKGIFHSLAQDCIEPDEFMARANKALVYCLERGSFISAIFFLINTGNKTVRYARAGHCPVLYYSAATGKAEYFKDKGVALGMVRNNSYKNFIEAKEFAYQPGDIMVLYTDGITEAKSAKGEEFGYDRLASVLMDVKEQSSREIQEYLIKKLYEFSGTDNINDDYTTMIVKFNNRT